jgi:ATP-dependent exoDNAse (exonuclease V) alpha subunit
MNNLIRFFSEKPKDDMLISIKKLEAFLSNDAQVFILKGYAGTGKTTMMKSLINYLAAEKRPYVLMASTGRAAKVLSDKTRENAKTIHSKIYKLDEVNDSGEVQKITFSLKMNFDDVNTVYIIDEASMIPDKPSLSGLLNYGDGRLLAHILNYVQGRKIIFIGDPAQLPPVKNKFSAALHEDYITRGFGIKAVATELTKVWRQKEDSGILYNASRLRYPEIETPTGITIKASGFDDIILCYQQSELVRRYVDLVSQNGFDNAIILTYGNKSVLKFNQMVRQYIFPGINSAVAGDWLMVVYNNYKHNLANGQHVTLLDISPSFEKRANLTFRDATLEVTEHGNKQLVNCKMIEDLLFRPEPSLDFEAENDLMKDFAIRMYKVGIKPKSSEYRELFLSDPYLNAVRVKFGYAITGHKAQGGEWDNVMLQLEYSLDYQELENVYRWIYTAITRAAKKLYLLRNKLVV